MMKVVVYAEGPGERLGRRTRTFELPKKPGQILLEQHDELGAAHHLTRRSIAHVTQVPQDAVQFEEPLRHRAMIARGSHLTNPAVLPTLLVWPMSDMRPELAVVFVDCDGRSDRKSKLERVISTLKPRLKRVVAVAVQEFESWLIGDIAAVNTVLRLELDEPAAPEAMNPRGAKRLLADWIAQSERSQEDTLVLRSDIAKNCSLEQVASRSPSFEQFLDELRDVLHVSK
jgi:hypothetical protein